MLTVDRYQLCLALRRAARTLEAVRLNETEAARYRPRTALMVHRGRLVIEPVAGRRPRYHVPCEGRIPHVVIRVNALYSLVCRVPADALACLVADALGGVQIEWCADRSRVRRGSVLSFDPLPDGVLLVRYLGQETAIPAWKRTTLRRATRRQTQNRTPAARYL